MSEQAPRRSVELFKSGFFSAESMLLAIAESQGIRSDLIPRIATGFCNGISRTGGMGQSDKAQIPRTCKDRSKT